MVHYTAPTATPLKKVWQHLLHKIEFPENFIPGVSNVVILEKNDEFVIRQMDVLMNDKPVTLKEKITFKPYKVRFELLDHPTLKGYVDNDIKCISDSETEITFTVNWKDKITDAPVDNPEMVKSAVLKTIEFIEATKKIIVFGGSSSTKSINKQLAIYAANLFQNVDIEILDLNDYEMPVFSVDKQAENGIHPLAHAFYEKLGSADLHVISLAEHNGAYSAAFKNILDWSSRINTKTFQGKPMLLMATSPGARGGSNVLEIAKNRFPRQGAILKGTFSLPSFEENFNPETGITDETLRDELKGIAEGIVF